VIDEVASVFVSTYLSAVDEDGVCVTTGDTLYLHEQPVAHKLRNRRVWVKKDLQTNDPVFYEDLLAELNNGGWRAVWVPDTRVICKHCHLTYFEHASDGSDKCLFEPTEFKPLEIKPCPKQSPL
jgi:hypothetical protein